MQVRYDDRLVEAAVNAHVHARRAPDLQLRRFHAERERLYAILEPDARDAAFRQLQLEWFCEWGFDQQLTAPLADYPALEQALSLLAFRQTLRAPEEGAELYVNTGGQRHGVLTLRAERLERQPDLGYFLHHELAHLNDMVTPTFDYSPELPLTASPAIEANLLRERYRVLWDISVTGRLRRGGRAPASARDRCQREFERAYRFWPADKQAATFDRLWNDPEPRHQELLALATDPKGLRERRGPAPGAACPLCRFPTFDWAASPLLSAEICAAIRGEFPVWQPEDGVCTRCAEMYKYGALAAR